MSLVAIIITRFLLLTPKRQLGVRLWLAWLPGDRASAASTTKPLCLATAYGAVFVPYRSFNVSAVSS